MILTYPINLKHPALGSGTWLWGSVTCLTWGTFQLSFPEAPRNTLLFKADESDLAHRVVVWNLSLPAWSAWTPTCPYSETLSPQAHTLTLEVPTFFLHGHTSLFARVWVNSSLTCSCSLHPTFRFTTHPQTHLSHIYKYIHQQLRQIYTDKTLILMLRTWSSWPHSVFQSQSPRH